MTLPEFWEQWPGPASAAMCLVTAPEQPYQSPDGVCQHAVMELTMRFEIFPDDLDATVDFYTRVLRFTVTKDERDDPGPYVSLTRGGVHAGALRTELPGGARAARRPPAGVELVLEVDDVIGERDWVVGAGWPLTEDLQDRSWGLKDFRILDPAGYYLRITDRASRQPDSEGARPWRRSQGAQTPGRVSGDWK